MKIGGGVGMKESNIKLGLRVGKKEGLENLRSETGPLVCSIL